MKIPAVRDTHGQCPACNSPMTGFVQLALYPGATDRVYEHCVNEACALEGVTLSAGEHDHLTPHQIKAYAREKALRAASDAELEDAS